MGDGNGRKAETESGRGHYRDYRGCGTKRKLQFFLMSLVDLNPCSGLYFYSLLSFSEVHLAPHYIARKPP